MTLQEDEHPTSPSRSVFLFDSIVEMIHDFPEAELPWASLGVA